MRLEKIDIEKIVPNPWNPNKMDDKTFNMLADELNEENENAAGYIVPIQVVEVEDGKYMIVGGEHRWRAMRANGAKEIECVVLEGDKWKDEDFLKFKTVSLNVLHGKLDPKKFVKLYESVADRYREEVLQEMFGFADEAEWKRYVKSVRSSLKDAGATKEQLREFDRAAKEVKTVEGLSAVVNRIFSKYGGTVDKNFIWFSWGGEEQLYVQVSRSDWKVLERVMDTIEASDHLDAAVVFGEKIREIASEICPDSVDG